VVVEARVLLLVVQEAQAVEVLLAPVLAQTELQTEVVVAVEASGQTMARQAVKVLLLLSGDFNNGLLC
jgi:hypothetical protein